MRISEPISKIAGRLPGDILPPQVAVTLTKRE